MSFYKWDGLGTSEFIGLANFKEVLFADRVFWIAFFNNLKWAAMFMTVPIAMGLVVGFLLTTAGRFRIFYMGLFFVPVILSRVVVARLWAWLMNPFYGVNKVFKGLGLDSFTQSWLGNPKIALYSVAFVDNWAWWGFVMVIFMAAYQQIDPTYYEAAALDGASRYRTFIHITIPLIRPTLWFILLLTAMWSFKAFDFIYILTQGGPGNATELLTTWLYKEGILNFRAGYASALAVILLLISGGIILGFFRLQRE
jgi:raffinose/stachyose/melibiose transport system permease protein